MITPNKIDENQSGLLEGTSESNDITGPPTDENPSSLSQDGSQDENPSSPSQDENPSSPSQDPSKPDNTDENLPLNNVLEDKQLSAEEKQKLTKITGLLEATVTSLTDITADLKSDKPDIEKAVNGLNATAAKLKSENPVQGGKSRRKACKNKKKNKTKKGGRKSKKNQKNKR